MVSKITYFKKAIAVIITAMAFFVVSCEKRLVIEEPLTKKATKELAEADHFAKAEQYWDNKEYDEALKAYNLYLERFPKGENAKIAKTRKAYILYEKGIFDRALPLLLDVIDKYPTERRAEIHLLTAKTYYYLKRYPESRLSALKWLELYEYYPRKEEVFYLLGKNLIRLDEKTQAFSWWLKAIESPTITEEKRIEIKDDLLDLIFLATETELKEMAEHAKDSELINPVYYRLSAHYLSLENLDEAREAAKKIIEAEGNEEWIFKAKEILDRINERLEVNPHVIGCLLPLSGSFSPYGKEVLNGLELGLDIFQEEDSRLSLLELAIRDTKGESQAAIEQLEDLARNEKIIVNIGPLISKVAKNVAEKAQELGLPNITLSQQEDITETGNMIFQNCLTPEDEIERLFNKVILERGLMKFAILYPDNAYGQYFMNKFWDKVESIGGEITAAESYNTEQTDFSNEIKKIAGLFYPRPQPDVEDLLLPPEEISQSYDELKPIIDFDAIFIPDSFERVALIASQLTYYDVKGVTLLGTSLWNSPKLIEIAGRHVRRSVFPSGFFPQSRDKNIRYFVHQYKALFGKTPSFLAALGYDTIKMIKEIIREKGDNVRTRDDLRQALSYNTTFDGVTGQIEFDYKRRAKRSPILLTILGGQFFPLP